MRIAVFIENNGKSRILDNNILNYKIKNGFLILRNTDKSIQAIKLDTINSYLIYNSTSRNIFNALSKVYTIPNDNDNNTGATECQ